MLWTLLGLVCPIFFGFLFYLRWTRNYSYWQDRKVACVPAKFPFGSFGSAFRMKETMFAVLSKVYDEFENEDVVGMYGPTSPCLLIRDLTLAKEVLIDNFNNFMDNGLEPRKSVEPMLGYNPVGLNGQEWKDSRAIHSAVMTPSKIDGMVADMVKSARSMANYIKNEHKEASNVFPYLRMYLIDVVCKCAYGLETHLWTKPEPMIKSAIFVGITAPDFESNVSVLSALLLPWANEITRCKIFSHEAFNFGKKIYQTAVSHRKESNIVRNDLVQRLMEVNQKLRDSGKTEFDEMKWATNLMVMYIDGVETASIVMSFIIYLLAKHPEVQKKARDEIRGKGITMDNLDHQKLKTFEYLETVIQESLRMFPPVPMISRMATKDTTVGKVHVPKGMKVFVPNMKFQNDPKYFENPEIFDPGRFEAYRNSSVPKAAYLAFGEGPRICVGERYARTSIRVGLIAILSEFELSLGPSHTGDIQPDKNSTFILLPDEGMVEIKFTPALNSDSQVE